ncbi:MAG: hypothetical protein F6K18_18025 [Okeania sp. SIO2C2]|uniref:hypothetical protein n=1 Tax=Okeania sp. SIO2C2 TaxID=2607787 RepID=UPI0013B86CDF|nr:hypothetical protein [Okeania sp. SIO2C2]NEP88577.1 hypothetical protein [Okeania sp. SIO2C2]
MLLKFEGRRKKEEGRKRVGSVGRWGDGEVGISRKMWQWRSDGTFFYTEPERI